MMSATSACKQHALQKQERENFACIEHVEAHPQETDKIGLWSGAIVHYAKCRGAAVVQGLTWVVSQGCKGPQHILNALWGELAQLVHQLPLQDLQQHGPRVMVQ